MLTVDQAWDVIRKHTRVLRPEITALTSGALGLVLAEPVASDLDSPPYAKAMMDGYAVRTADLEHLPTTLSIIEEIAAGQQPTLALNAGQTSRIMTGAMIPEGADAVIQHEWTQTAGSNVVQILRAVQRGQNILPRGQEMRAGEVVLEPGTIVRPQVFGILAAVGKTTIRTYPLPRVAILSTGDELVEPMMKPGPCQIRNTNGSMLLAQSVRAGSLPRYLGIARDDCETLRSLILEGLNSADVLILSGGVSAGKYDLVPEILAAEGMVAHFHKVQLKPGKPLLFGTRKDTLVFGLPGNPVSSFVCFELLIHPTLKLLRGMSQPRRELVQARMSEPFTTENDRPTYWPAEWSFTPSGPVVRALPWLGSADLRGLKTANALLVIPPGPQQFQPGDHASMLRLDVD